MNKTYYEILGVSSDADTKTIKSAYRVLIKQYHPDINKEPGSEIKFKEIQEAYEVLSDEEKRNRYDNLGHQGYTTSQNQGGFDYSKYQQGFNAKFVNLNEMKWYQKLLMVIVLVFLFVAGIIVTVIYAIINLILRLFRK